MASAIGTSGSILILCILCADLCRYQLPTLALTPPIRWHQRTLDHGVRDVYALK